MIAVIYVVYPASRPPFVAILKADSLKQEDLFDRAIRAGFGWVSYRLPSKGGTSVPEPQHFIDPEANAERPWLESSRNGFVITPFSLVDGPELWLSPWIRWAGTAPNSQALTAASEWLDLSAPIDELTMGRYENSPIPEGSRISTEKGNGRSDSQHYIEFCQSVRQIAAILQNKAALMDRGEEPKGLQKVVWSRVKTISLHPEAHPCLLFEALCQAYPTLHIVLLYHPVYGIWLGCSPETLVEKEAMRIRSVALAGTRNPAHTAPWTNKEIREQGLVFDYLQERFAIKAIQSDSQDTSTVQKGPVEHLLNKIEGISNISCYEMAHCLHPTPAVAGFPIAESVKYILENEPHKRLLYAGYWGYINEEGDGLLSVNLRCLHWLNGKATLYMGAGIMPESDADAEWLETCTKSETLMNILQSLDWISSPAEVHEE